MHAERRLRPRARDAVRVEHREAHARVGDLRVEARVVRALRQPHPERPPPDERLERVHAEPQLRADARRLGEHPGQVAVRRRARDQLDPPRVPMLAECTNHVAVVALPHGAHARELLAVERRERRELGVAVEAHHLLFGELLDAREVLVEALAEELVAQHRRERRREAHRERERHPLVGEPVEDVDQRQVALDERLVEPPLLEVPRVLRVAHEGQVRVEDDREVAVRHGGRGA